MKANILTFSWPFSLFFFKFQTVFNHFGVFWGDVQTIWVSHHCIQTGCGASYMGSVVLPKTTDNSYVDSI